jgi:hypothetical protein
MIQQRYIEFIARAMHVKRPLIDAGRDPGFLAGSEFGPLLRILRMRAYSDGRKLYPVVSDKPPIPEFTLVNNCSVTQHDKLLDAMEAPAFDPLWHVILEQDPVPAPDPNGRPGTVSVLDRSSDHFVLDINTPSSAILLNTDAYAPGWRATPLAPGPQDSYQVLPADYIVRGIPLAAGRHLIRLEYAPSGFGVGKWVSLVSAAMYIGVVGIYAWRRRLCSIRRGQSGALPIQVRP